MKCTDLYRQAYGLLDHITPLRGDCGTLCGQACCKDGEDAGGMYLFPGELEAMGRAGAHFSVEPSDLEYLPGRFAPIAMCPGTCDRGARPLSCRIFPLAPYLRQGRLEIILDPRGLGLCPIVRLGRQSVLRRDFVARVDYLFRVLCKNTEIHAFVRALSALYEEMAPWQGRRL